VADELARAVGVTRRCGDVLAIADATVSFEAGKIHAVCGENGAGKTTLLKIVAGMHVPDSGHVDAFGERLSPHTPREAIARGVGMVLQHFALVPVFTALENIVLGAEPTSALGVLDLASARTRARAIAKDLGVELQLDALVADLGVGDRQRLEIARALYRDAKLLILDEPTAVLTKTEAAALYATLRRLAEGGKGIVVVTHKMDEVRAYADVVTVLRRGRLVFTKPIDRQGAGAEGRIDAQVKEITAAIMGASPEAAPSATTAGSPAASAGGDVLLALEHVTSGLLEDVSLEVRRGEIVGVAGVEGNGQSELVALIAGDRPPAAGRVTATTTAVVREDRQTDGLVLDATLRDNIVLGELGTFTGRGGLVDLAALESEAVARLERSGAPVEPERLARSLSGGNQQKIVVARALARLSGAAGARVLVASHPTRGVDLAASADIHARLRAAAAAGAGVLVISADLDELRALCTRILVLARGRVVADLPPSTSDEELGRLMLGLASARSGSEAEGAS